MDGWYGWMYGWMDGEWMGGVNRWGGFDCVFLYVVCLCVLVCEWEWLCEVELVLLLDSVA